MDVAALLTEEFERIRGLLRTGVQGLDVRALTLRVGPAANPIGWLAWHLTRVQDDHLAGVAERLRLAGHERGQVWTRDGWVDRFGLPLEVDDIGYGHTCGQVAAVVVGSGQLLADYHQAVHVRTVEIIAALDAARLDQIVDERWDPPVTAGVRLASVVSDCLQHLGQIAFIRGLAGLDDPS